MSNGSVKDETNLIPENFILSVKNEILFLSKYIFLKSPIIKDYNHKNKIPFSKKVRMIESERNLEKDSFIIFSIHINI